MYNLSPFCVENDNLKRNNILDYYKKDQDDKNFVM